MTIKISKNYTRKFLIGVAITGCRLVTFYIRSNIKSKLLHKLIITWLDDFIFSLLILLLRYFVLQFSTISYYYVIITKYANKFPSKVTFLKWDEWKGSILEEIIKECRTYTHFPFRTEISVFTIDQLSLASWIMRTTCNYSFTDWKSTVTLITWNISLEILLPKEGKSPATSIRN